MYRGEKPQLVLEDWIFQNGLWCLRAEPPRRPEPSWLQIDRTGHAGDNTAADPDLAVCIGGDPYLHGATSAEIGLRQLMRERNWTSGAETRTGLSAQMMWLLGTGRYPAYERYTREGARKDDLQWQFETGLEQILDGIAARLARRQPPAG